MRINANTTFHLGGTAKMDLPVRPADGSGAHLSM